jgi:hypothetical protein
MRKSLAALLVFGWAVPAAAQQQFPATLVGHAILPADTLVAAPADAPLNHRVSGKYAGGPLRLDADPTAAPALPLAGQPVQGFSGIKTLGDGTYLVLTDNGFGSKANSPDAMLMFHHIRPDFVTGDVEVLATTFISDPNGMIPFLIANEATEARYLTGWDLDIEGFQPIGDRIYIGDEFGPYVIAVDRQTGIVEAFFETYADGEVVRSPDNYALQLPNPGGDPPAYNLRRSRGYEGFAASPDGTMLYGLLEGPLFDAEAGDFETVGGIEALRILEFSVAAGAFTGDWYHYPLEADGHAIGDFNMIDDHRALVIERDGGQGDAELGCTGGATENCFASPALFKRIYLISFDGVAPGEPVRKVGYIDLLDIADPDGVARLGMRDDGRFTFPFVTIEDVDIVDATHIIVGNDNNYPFSVGRALGALDNNEIVLLEVADFLAAE